MKYQKGEVMIVVMVVILVATWAWTGHMGMGPMGMMAHGTSQDEKTQGRNQQNNNAAPDENHSKEIK